MLHSGDTGTMGQVIVGGGGMDLPSDHGSAKGRKPKKMPELNVVAMLDVCFNLLIFFIATVSFSVGEGVLPAELPVGQGSGVKEGDPPKTPIMLMLRSRGGEDVAIELQGSVSALDSFEELYNTLFRLQRSAANPNGIYMPDDPVIIQPDSNVRWDAVVNAFNQAVRAKFMNVNFAQPPKN